MMIVLHTTRYGDSSLIVHGYTREEGRTSLMLRGAFRTSGKRRPSHPGAVLLHPLSIVNYVASKSPKAGMAYLREFSPKYRLHSIREDFDKISIAMFISELLYRTLLHSERDEDLYDFLEDAVLRLEALGSSPANFHLWFLDRYAAYLGFPFESGFNLDYNPFTPDRCGAQGAGGGRPALVRVPYRLPHRPAFGGRPASDCENPLIFPEFSLTSPTF